MITWMVGLTLMEYQIHESQWWYLSWKPIHLEKSRISSLGFWHIKSVGSGGCWLYVKFYRYHVHFIHFLTPASVVVLDIDVVMLLVILVMLVVLSVQVVVEVNVLVKVLSAGGFLKNAAQHGGTPVPNGAILGIELATDKEENEIRVNKIKGTCGNRKPKSHYPFQEVSSTELHWIAHSTSFKVALWTRLGWFQPHETACFVSIMWLSHSEWYLYPSKIPAKRAFRCAWLNESSDVSWKHVEEVQQQQQKYKHPLNLPLKMGNITYKSLWE